MTKRSARWGILLLLLFIFCKYGNCICAGSSSPLFSHRLGVTECQDSFPTGFFVSSPIAVPSSLCRPLSLSGRRGLRRTPSYPAATPSHPAAPPSHPAATPFHCCLSFPLAAQATSTPPHFGYKARIFCHVHTERPQF